MRSISIPGLHEKTDNTTSNKPLSTSEAVLPVGHIFKIKISSLILLFEMGFILFNCALYKVKSREILPFYKSDSNQEIQIF